MQNTNTNDGRKRGVAFRWDEDVWQAAAIEAVKQRKSLNAYVEGVMAAHLGVTLRPRQPVGKPGHRIEAA